MRIGAICLGSKPRLFSNRLPMGRSVVLHMSSLLNCTLIPDLGAAQCSAKPASIRPGQTSHQAIDSIIENFIATAAVPYGVAGPALGAAVRSAPAGFKGMAIRATRRPMTARSLAGIWPKRRPVVPR